MHTLVHYTERDGVDILLCTTYLRFHHGYRAYTTTPLPYTKSGIFPPYTQMESVWANNCRSVFASSTPTSKGTFNRCPEPLRVGIRFITMKIEALGSYNEDTKIPRIG